MNPVRPARAPLRDEGGQSLVEFALILPLVLLILLGIMDFGKAFNYWITENQVASEGARRAAVNIGSATLQQYVLSQIKTKDLHDRASVCVTFPDSGLKTVGHPVKVTVAMGYAWIPFLKRFGNIGTLTLRNSATMRLEANSTVLAANDVKPAGC
jgi:hypothetical protein